MCVERHVKSRAVAIVFAMASALALVVVPSSGSARAAAPPPAATPASTSDAVEALVQEALAKHPTLAARAARVEAASHAAVRAGAWDPPRVGVGVMSFPITRPGFGSFDMTGVEIMVEEEFPWPGRLEAWKRAAAARVAEARASEASATNDLASAVRRAAWRLWLADTALDYWAREIERRGSLRDLVRAAVIAKGGADAVAVLDLERMLAEARAEQLDARADRAAAAAALASLLGRTGAAGLAGKEFAPARPAAPGSLDDAAAALDASPRLRVMSARADEADARAVALKREAFPSIGVRVSYLVRSDALESAGGSDLLSAAVTVPLPVFAGMREGRDSKEARAMAAAERADREAMRLAMRGELLAALAMQGEALAALDVYDHELVPAAEAAFNASRAAVVSGTAGVDRLIIAEEPLVGVLLGRARVLFRAAVAAEEVRALVGVAAVPPPPPAAPGGAR